MEPTADLILSVPVGEPGRLFPDRSRLREEYHALLKKWHPDVSRDPRAVDVTSHLTRLFDSAERLASSPELPWLTEDHVELRGTDGKTRRVGQKVHREFDLGESYYGHNNVLYKIRGEYVDLAQRGLDRIRGLKYSSDRMKKEITKYVPTEVRSDFKMADGSRVVILGKLPTEYCLADVVSSQGGKLPVPHACWVVSGLLNLACYFKWAGFAHCGISTESVYVDPAMHTVRLVGGWWYSTDIGSRPRALPTSTFGDATEADKKSMSSALDLTMIRTVGRQLLGDRSGTVLSSLGVPGPIASFLRLPTTGDAMRDYEQWIEEVLPSAGGRRFVKLDVKESDVFKERTHG